MTRFVADDPIFLNLETTTQEEPQVLFSVTNEAYGVVKDTTREAPVQSISLEHNASYETPSLSYTRQVLFSATNEAYGVVKDATIEAPVQSISLEHNAAYETPSLTHTT